MSVGGRLDIAQVVPGKLADFNMWQREMTADELNSQTCGAEGNAVSWNTLREQGSSPRTKHFLPGCNGKTLYLSGFKQHQHVKTCFFNF